MNKQAEYGSGGACEIACYCMKCIGGRIADAADKADALTKEIAKAEARGAERMRAAILALATRVTHERIGSDDRAVSVAAIAAIQVLP